MLNYLHTKPEIKALFKVAPEDFVVRETLNFEPSGEGEHLLVKVEKTGANTHFVAKQIADYCDVPGRNVTYAGLKDRHSVSEQWFGVWLPGKSDVDFTHWHIPEVKILDTVRHNKKLRLGAIKYNYFEIRLKSLSKIDGLEERLDCIKQQGVPNYFGEQRFGRYEDNVEMAREMFAGKRVKDKKKRSLYMSAARSHLFNQVLSQRIELQLMDSILEGDALMLNGSHSFFVAEQIDEELKRRLAEGDIVLSGPLVGDGELTSQSAAKAMEMDVLKGFQDLQEGLANARLNQERKALKLFPQDMSWQLESDQLILTFKLPKGTFATSVLRELVEYQDAS